MLGEKIEAQVNEKHAGNRAGSRTKEQHSPSMIEHEKLLQSQVRTASQIDRISTTEHLIQDTAASNNKQDGDDSRERALASISPEKSELVPGRLDKKRVRVDESASSEDSTARSGAPKLRSEPANHIIRSQNIFKSHEMFKEEDQDSTVETQFKRICSLASSERQSETSSLAPTQPQLFLAIGTRTSTQDVFHDPGTFSLDAVPDEASQRAKSINSFLDLLDIKQVQIKEVLDSLRKIESSDVFEQFDIRRKSSSFLGSQSASSRSKALPLYTRRRQQLGIAAGSQFFEQDTDKFGSNSVTINRKNSYIENFSIGAQNEFRRRELLICNNKNKVDVITKTQSNCQFRLSVGLAVQDQSNQNAGNKQDFQRTGDLSAKLMHEDNSSFGSRGINPLQSAQRLNSNRKKTFENTTESQLAESPLRDHEQADRSMNPSQAINDNKQEFKEQPFKSNMDLDSDSVDEEEDECESPTQIQKNALLIQSLQIGSSNNNQIFEEQYRQGKILSSSPTLNHSPYIDPMRANLTANDQPCLDRPSRDAIDALTSLTLQSSSTTASTNQQIKQILYHTHNKSIGETGLDVVSLGSTGTSAISDPRVPATGPRVTKASLNQPPLKINTIKIKETSDGTRILHDFLQEQKCPTDADLASPETLASGKGIGLTNKLQEKQSMEINEIMYCHENTPLPLINPTLNL